METTPTASLLNKILRGLKSFVSDVQGDKSLQAQFIFGLGNSERHWNRTGDDLLLSGERLLDYSFPDPSALPPAPTSSELLAFLDRRPRTNDAAIMLICMALECFYKARICANGGNPLPSETKAKHDLGALAAVAKVDGISKQDILRLTALSRHITWHGRYPVPTKPAFLLEARRSKEFPSDYEAATAENLRKTVDFLHDQIARCKE